MSKVIFKKKIARCNAPREHNMSKNYNIYAQMGEHCTNRRVVNDLKKMDHKVTYASDDDTIFEKATSEQQHQQQQQKQPKQEREVKQQRIENEYQNHTVDDVIDTLTAESKILENRINSYISEIETHAEEKNHTDEKKSREGTVMDDMLIIVGGGGGESIKNSTDFCNFNFAIDLTVFIIGLIIMLFSIIVVEMSSDFLVYRMYGNSVFDIWATENDQQSKIPIKSETYYGFWNSKTAFVTFVVSAPFFLCVYFASVSVARLEIVKLCVDVSNMVYKKREALNHSVRMMEEEEEEEAEQQQQQHTDHPIAYDSDLRKRKYKGNTSPQSKEDILYDQREIVRTTRYTLWWQVDIFRCCSGESEIENVTINSSGEHIPMTQDDSISFKECVNEKGTTSCRRFILYFIVYFVSVIASWMFTKLVSFQIYGTMTISDVKSSIKVTNYEWFGWFDFYVIMYHCIVNPIVFTISKKLTNDVIVETLMYLCDDR